MFKKNNSIFKKQNINKNIYNIFYKKYNFLESLTNKNCFYLNKYFSFFENNNSSNINNLNLKLLDLKKKFVLNLYNFKNNFNLILNKKKTKKKTLFKNFKLFIYFFKKK